MSASLEAESLPSRQQCFHPTAATKLRMGKPSQTTQVYYYYTYRQCRCRNLLHFIKNGTERGNYVKCQVPAVVTMKPI
jgi:hypothetical protein